MVDKCKLAGMSDLDAAWLPGVINVNDLNEYTRTFVRKGIDDKPYYTEWLESRMPFNDLTRPYRTYEEYFM